MEPRRDAKFVQVAYGPMVDTIIALDSDGNVWKYYPATIAVEGKPGRKAFWGAITTYRANPHD